ncbi:MAG: class D sortase [Candidatus Koribacter versatilis]|uniref:Class D sortase n=1 Tax=Candidatus Korobacter versatilis TaxID=658062 RepID=A0A932A6V5_9BACT|nr:class D sortase [Candidatus Koribacter versatilis]
MHRLSGLRARLSQLGTRPLGRGITVRRAWPFALILAGLALVIYVAAQYGTMAWEQHRLARQWEEHYEAQQNAPAGSPAIIDGGLIRVSIPKIELDAIVVEGTTYKKLLVGPGHMEKTALPGETGNAVITAHRDTFFRRIFELKKGDEILVRRRGEVFRFQVTGKQVVDPSDISVTRQSEDARLTLITCYPTYFIGPAPERLVVFSKLLDRSPDTARAAATSPTSELPAPRDSAGGTSH